MVPFDFILLHFDSFGFLRIGSLCFRFVSFRFMLFHFVSFCPWFGFASLNPLNLFIEFQTVFMKFHRYGNLCLMKKFCWPKHHKNRSETFEHKNEALKQEAVLIAILARGH